jgi:WD40 repeat protein
MYGNPKVSNSAPPGIQSAEDAEQEAAERNLIRRVIDYHGPAVMDVQNRLYATSCRSHHIRQRTSSSSIYTVQPHSNYIRCMGLPIRNCTSAPIPSELFLTYRAHVTRAKNSTPIICLSWTPGGRRLLTGNHEGEFTLWDGCTLLQLSRLHSVSGMNSFTSILCIESNKYSSRFFCFFFH